MPETSTPTVLHETTGISFRWRRDPDVVVELFWCRDRRVWLTGVGAQGREPQREQTPVDLPQPVGDDDAEAIARWWGGGTS